eukprot:362360-Chlamydomonas_euryale.AAC.9
MGRRWRWGEGVEGGAGGIRRWRRKEAFTHTAAPTGHTGHTAAPTGHTGHTAAPTGHTAHSVARGVGDGRHSRT